jgi:L-alanine-DL-glutamate epimerase-like enolase superfamily enzyme
MRNVPDLEISSLSLWRVPLTSHETYYMASGKACATVDSMVVRIETKQGVSGWGEVCPIPHYLPAYANGVAPALEELAPVLIGRSPIGAEAAMAACNKH